MKSFRIFLTLAFVPLMAGTLQAGFVWNGQNGAPTVATFIQMKLQDYEVALLPYNSTTDGPGSASPLTQYSTQDIIQRAIPLGLINTSTGLNSGNSFYPGSTGSIIGDQIYSIFQITSINAAVGGQQYWIDAPNQHLVGSFTGLTVSSFNTSNGNPSPGTLNFTGGTANLYFDGNTVTQFNSSTGPFTAGWAGIATSNGVGTGSETNVLSGIGVGGVAADSTISLSSTFSLLNTSTGHLVGNGNGFLTQTLDTVFGFDPDGVDGSTFSPPYPGNQTFSFQSNFNNQPTGYSSPGAYQTAFGWSINSQDPVTGEVVLPEPASFLVWGGLLAGALVVGRRRKS